METFHLYHLAACWKGRTLTTKAGSTPLTAGPVNPTISQTTSSPTHLSQPAPLTLPNSVIRAAATHLVFASRKSQDFITPRQVAEVEKWTGQVRVPRRCPCPRIVEFANDFASSPSSVSLQGVLNALVNMAIPQDVSISSFEARLLMISLANAPRARDCLGNLVGI